EDGIRDFHVTGVQTCALPIWLLEANGHADNHVIFISQAPLVVLPSVAAEAFGLMDQWLANIEADTSNDPREVKVVRNKPAGAVEIGRASCRGSGRGGVGAGGL